jgi:hypothetical protein
VSRLPGEATIARLLVHGAGSDPIAERLRLERLLGQLELRPRSLCATAILCIRELRDPLPGRLSLSSRESRPPAEWAQAMQREVDRFAGVAVWPARSSNVTAEIEAVAFADDAELLACLGSDLVSGSVALRWWWKLLVPRVEDAGTAVATKWRDSVEHAPAALDRLQERGQSAPFILALSALGVRALGAAIARRFALPVLASIATMPERPRRMVPAVIALHAPPPPWRAFFAESEEATLPPARAALLGILLTLGRAPALARSDTFAAQVFAWRDALEAPHVAVQRTPPSMRPAEPLSVVRTSSAPPDAGSVAAAVEAAAQKPARVVPPAPQRLAERSGIEPAKAENEAIQAIAGPAPVEAIAAPLAAETPALIAAPAEAVEQEKPAAAAAAPPAVQAKPLRSSPPKLLSLRPRTRAFGPAVETRLGGVFYLINLALYEKLYGDDENLSLSLWDFLELTGRRLLNQPSEDPLWLLLAQLSGRPEGAPPGEGFNPPGGLEAWLDELVPRLDARLRLALGLAPQDDLPGLLLRRRAQVHVTETHVDVVSLLETLPVAIRLAGLDRDPGWVAAAGRFIAFHFE